MLERRIEEASLNNWPALQQMLFDGWILRFSEGYTKRANSITPIYTSFLPVQEKIVACENFYHKKQLPTIFRLLSFSSATADLNSLLAQRNYQRIDHTLVLSTQLSPDTTTHRPALNNVPLAEWLSLFYQFKQVPTEQQQIHSEMLAHSACDLLCAVLYHDGVPVACGLGMLENDIFGLFDIVTDSEQRNKGYGTQLVAAMLSWARQHGASRAYLQVTNANQAALHLYKKFGFHELYHYWYRIQNL